MDLGFIPLGSVHAHCAEESLSAGEARELLKQYQLQLEELESGISAYREELGSISEQAKARSNQYTSQKQRNYGNSAPHSHR